MFLYFQISRKNSQTQDLKFDSVLFLIIILKVMLMIFLQKQ